MYCDLAASEIESAELKRIHTGGTEILACPRCDSVIMEHESRVVKPLVSELATAFLYPFRPVTLVVSLVVVVVAGGIGFIPAVGGVIGAGIRFGWLFAILRASSDGSEDVDVDASDIGGSFLGWIGPAIRFFLACFVAFLPAMIAAAALGDPSSIVVGAFGVLGLFYLPAGCIAAAEASTWYAPLNPVPAFILITRIPGAYLLGCGMLIVLFGIAGGVIALASMIQVPFVGAVVAGMLGYLPLVAAARMLGILVYEKREEL